MLGGRAADGRPAHRCAEAKPPEAAPPYAKAPGDKPGAAPVGVFSTPGRGFRFTVEIPLV